MKKRIFITLLIVVFLACCGFKSVDRMPEHRAVAGIEAADNSFSPLPDGELNREDKNKNHQELSGDEKKAGKDSEDNQEKRGGDKEDEDKEEVDTLSGNGDYTDEDSIWQRKVFGMPFWLLVLIPIVCIVILIIVVVLVVINHRDSEGHYDRTLKPKTRPGQGEAASWQQMAIQGQPVPAGMTTEDTLLQNQGLPSMEPAQMQQLKARSGLEILLEMKYGRGPAGGDRYVLYDRLVIGSDPGCDIVLSAGEASAVHAAITLINGQICIEEIDQESGVYLEGMRIYLHNRIDSGDEISLGKVGFLVRY